MPYRYFVDSQGVHWRVWDVTPRLIDRRHAIRRVKVIKIRHRERRVLPTRRIDMSQSRLFFPPTEKGWLCFETEGTRIRLSPYPLHWPALTDQELEELRQHADARPVGG